MKQAATLGLGTVQFGMRYGIANDTRTPLDEALRVLDAAVGAGLRVLDTAVAYGDAEKVIGEFVRGRPGHAGQLQVVSKLPPGTRDAAAVRDGVHASLERLGAGSLHGLLVHSPADLLSDQGQALWRAMCALRDEGLVTRIGVSVYDPTELTELTRRCQPDLVQIPCNLFDQRFLAGDLLPGLRRRGVEIHARSVYLQGLLLLSPDEARRRLGGALGELAGTALRHFRDALAERGLLPLQACLRFALDCGLLDTVVIGVNTVSELNDALTVAGGVGGTATDWTGLARDDRLVDPRQWH